MTGFFWVGSALGGLLVLAGTWRASTAWVAGRRPDGWLLGTGVLTLTGFLILAGTPGPRAGSAHAAGWVVLNFAVVTLAVWVNVGPTRISIPADRAVRPKRRTR